MRTLFQIILLAGFILSSLPGIDCPLQAQQSQQERISALCDSGFVLLDREDHEAARMVFREALDINRNHPEALLGMGRAMLGQPDGALLALNYLRRAVEQAPENLEAHYYKAYAHTCLARNEVRSRSDGKAALDEIEIVLSVNPSHRNAWYLRGLVYRDVFQDYGEAIEAFRTQIEVYPEHAEARAECLKAAVDAGEWEDAIETGESVLSLDSVSWEVIPYLAAAYWKSDRLDESMEVFNRFFGLAPEEERNLYFDLVYVLTPEEAQEFSSLGDEGRQTYWNHYWRDRNPDPKTMVNERLLEHFMRVAFARKEFSKGKWPWDIRGDLYVRYGEPDVRAGRGRPYATDELIITDWEFFIKKRDLHEQMGLTRLMYTPGELFPDPYEDLLEEVNADGGGTPEQWFYTDRGIDFTFENPVMNGVFLIADGSWGLMEAMGRRMPVISEEEEKIEIFDPLLSAVTFRGEDGKTEMEYAIGLLPDHIGSFRSMTGEHNFIEAQIDLFTPDWLPAGETTEQIRTIAARPQFEIRGNPVLVHNVTLSADPGDYLVSVLVMEPETGVRATVEEEMTFPDYSGDDLMISDILPAARIAEVGQGRSGRFIRGDLEVIPLPGRTLGMDQPLFIYFEIYNLVRDRFGGTRYRIEYAVSESASDDGALKRLFQGLGAMVGIRGRRSVLSSEFSRTGVQNDEQSHLEIDLSALPHGIYDLMVTITDQVSGQVVSKILTVRTLPPIPE